MIRIAFPQKNDLPSPSTSRNRRGAAGRGFHSPTAEWVFHLCDRLIKAVHHEIRINGGQLCLRNPSGDPDVGKRGEHQLSRVEHTYLDDGQSVV